MKKYYTKEHEWVSDEGKMGISEYAQKELGDVVFVDFPSVGDEFSAGDVSMNVESVKAVSDIYAPVDITVKAVNSALDDTPELVNEDAESGGWLLEADIKDASQLETLMDEASYANYVEELSK